MREVSPMVVMRDNAYYMKQVYCNQPSCKDYARKMIRPINHRERCRSCGVLKKSSWLKIDKPDTREYFTKKTQKKMIRGRD